MAWYCAITNPNCQRRAEADLAAKGYRVFWPRVKRWTSHARMKIAKEYPLFGRYIFVEIDFPQQSFGLARAANGVEAFISVAGAPVPFPDNWVEGMLCRYLAGEWDFVRQETVFYQEADGMLASRTNKPIPIGALVRIMEGEFEDMLATVTGRNKNGKLIVLPRGQRTPIVSQVANVRAA